VPFPEQLEGDDELFNAAMMGIPESCVGCEVAIITANRVYEAATQDRKFFNISRKSKFPDAAVVRPINSERVTRDVALIIGAKCLAMPGCAAYQAQPVAI